MIEQPTVLILGAGASAHLEYETGARLIDTICGNISKLDSRGGWGAIFQQLGFDLTEVRLFGEALQHSGQASVDAFLEHRPEFIDVGKVAIAIVLSVREHMHVLFGRTETNWYYYLYQKMCTAQGF